MYSTEGLKYAQPGILYEVCPASHQEEISIQHLGREGGREGGSGKKSEKEEEGEVGMNRKRKEGESKGE